MRMLLAALTLTALAAPGMARDRNQLPVATPAGPAKSCIPLQQIRQTHVRDDRTIDFEMNGRMVYRNTLPYACSGLSFNERFSYSTSLSQLCSVDTITVLESPGLSRGATCGLGAFQPVTLAKIVRHK